MTLPDFLLARIAEDEREAHVVSGGAEPIPLTEGLWAGEEGVMIVTPDRVLAECEAKRAILDELILARAGSTQRAADARWGLEFAARALALPYADHPDYREVWANG